MEIIILKFVANNAKYNQGGLRSEIMQRTNHTMSQELHSTLN